MVRHVTRHSADLRDAPDRWPVATLWGCGENGRSSPVMTRASRAALDHLADVGQLAAGRSLHTVTLLSDGRVLVVGGVSDSDTAELYDPATGRWSPAPSPGRAIHTVCGGCGLRHRNLHCRHLCRGRLRAGSR